MTLGPAFHPSRRSPQVHGTIYDSADFRGDIFASVNRGKNRELCGNTGFFGGYSQQRRKIKLAYFGKAGDSSLNLYLQQ
jgi:hypothetical protein